MPKTLRVTLIWLLLLSVLLGFPACTSPSDTQDTGQQTAAPVGQTCTVYFMVDEEIFATQTVDAGERVSRPASQPSKEDHFFLDWYESETADYAYDFTSLVWDDHLYLYARFQVDTTKLIHKITTEHMSAIVTINTEQYKPKKFLGIDWGKDSSTKKTSSGSGVVFSVTDSHVCILTNCHVALNYSGYSYYEVTVTDYKGKTYEGVLYHSVNKTETAISAEYDLAVIYIDIDRDDHSFTALRPAQKDAVAGDVAISVGAPDGQKNAIDFGKVKGYKQITLDETPKEKSDVTFDVLNHDAYTLPGSSGGALLNTDMDLIGIHYAGERGNAYNGYAIPASKIREFLDRYVYDN